MFRKSSGGGGYLNNVDGTIAGLSFKSRTFQSKKTGESYDKASVELSILLDGAPTPIVTYLDAGFVDGFTVNEDGSITQVEEGAGIRDTTELAKFIASAVEAGFPESNFETTEDGIVTDFSPLVGQRVRFKKVIDEAATKALGKRKDPNTGKEYNRDYLAVAEVYGDAPATSAKATRRAPVAKAAPAKGNGKGNGKATAASSDVNEQAVNVLLGILADAEGNAVNKSVLNGAVVKKALEDGIPAGERESLRKLITSEAFLAQMNGWSYDTKVVSL